MFEGQLLSLWYKPGLVYEIGRTTIPIIPFSLLYAFKLEPSHTLRSYVSSYVHFDRKFFLAEAEVVDFKIPPAPLPFGSHVFASREMQDVMIQQIWERFEQDNKSPSRTQPNLFTSMEMEGSHLCLSIKVLREVSYTEAYYLATEGTPIK